MALWRSALARSSVLGAWDCEVQVDGTVFSGLHRAYLIGASAVIRDVVEKCDTSNARIPLKDDAPCDVALMLSLIYEPLSDSLTEDNVEVALNLLLSQKYDMPDLRYVCETFISKIPLTVPNLPHWMSLSVQHGIESAQDRCYEFAADHSDAIRQYYRDRDRTKWAFMDRATMEAVLYGVAATSHRELLGGGAPLSAPSVQRLLPIGTPQLPLPPIKRS